MCILPIFVDRLGIQILCNYPKYNSVIFTTYSSKIVVYVNVCFNDYNVERTGRRRRKKGWGWGRREREGLKIKSNIILIQ